MKNVVIFADRDSSEIEKILSENEELNVRTLGIDEFKESQKYNPSVIILNCKDDRLKEAAMVTKLTAPTLVAADKFAHEIVFRGDSLHNRKYLHERLEAEMSRAKRYDTKLSCLLLDIDFFKVVNDMYGYDWGDVLLKKIAEMLKGFIRKEDILTRYGDEEFIVILPNTPEENAFLFAERFRRDIEKMEFIPAGEEEKHPITISGGISSFPFLENVDEDANTLIRYAEHALYNAKKRGKNKIVQFSQINIDY